MTTTKRPRLTPHQAEVFKRIEIWTRGGERTIPENLVGCRGACQHLAEKGYIEISEEYGPRGGRTFRYGLKR